MSKNKELVRRWTFGEAIAEASNTEKHDSKMASRKTSGEYGSGWSGTGSFEETLRLAAEGWPEGLGLISKALGNFPTKQAPVRRMRADVAGWYPDVVRAIAGDPLNMLTRVEELSHKATRIIVEGAFNCGVTAEQLAARGAAIAAAVDELESRGVRCEVEICYATARSGFLLADRVMVKRSQDALDLDRMAFALVNPSMYRRIGFGLWETAPDEYAEPIGIRPSQGYGCAASTPLTEEETRGAIVIPDRLLTAEQVKAVFEEQTRAA